jgi:predicted nucleotidyltransferase
MSKTLAHLQPHETAALGACIERLMACLDGQLVAAYLFGSKARGDFTPDSDLDLLIILEHVDGNIQDAISMLGARVSLEYDVLINTHILSRARWEEMTRQQATLWREARRDGVALTPALGV